MTERIETAEAFARGWAFPYAYSPADRAELCEAITARDAAIRADERRKVLSAAHAACLEANELYVMRKDHAGSVACHHVACAIRELPGFETTEEE